MILTQTPQVFKLDLLRQAFEKARQDLFIGTDESSLVERLEQVEVCVVLGTDRNIKITKPSDMDLARLYLCSGKFSSRACLIHGGIGFASYRIGQGWDTHRIRNRPAVNSGRRRIPCDFGLAGHSDADVLFHAVTDALLGALALGDIGMHFPDSAEQWKDAESRQFLQHALELARAMWLSN